MSPLVRGMYFEEFEVGHELSTSARTITETDIVNFAGLTGDFNFIHIDAVGDVIIPFDGFAGGDLDLFLDQVVVDHFLGCSTWIRVFISMK